MSSTAVAAAPPAVDVRGVVKLFGGTPALVRVELTVLPATVCALVGGNGAGKTTLLRVLGTALRPTAGVARVFGFDVAREAAEVRRRVDFLPAAGGFYPELSALENLRFVAAMRGSRVHDDLLAAALERVGLGRVKRDGVGTFSTGMVRRLALARLDLTRPALVLLDEPYAALDEEGRALVDGLLAETVAEGRTALVATHERERAEALADQLCRLERGLVVEDAGRPAAVERAAVSA